MRLVVLLFFGSKIPGWIYHDLYFVCVLHYISLSLFLCCTLLLMVYFILICSTNFIQTLFLFLLILLFVDYFVILLPFQGFLWLFVAIYAWSFNSPILIIKIYWKNILIFVSKRRWWISLTFISKCYFYLPIFGPAGCNRGNLGPVPAPVARGCHGPPNTMLLSF